MRIAITGATGFVGSHLVRHLAQEKHTVFAYGRKSVVPEPLKEYASYISWDFSDNPLIFAPAVDAFIHSAGFVEFWGSYKDMYAVNVEGTRKALAAAKGAKHFIYISTASVYGSFHNKHEVSEELGGQGPYSNNYARTKAAAEELIHQEAHKFESVTILRPHAVYGPGDRVLVPRILKSIRGNFVPIIGSGENKFSITHIGNLCAGISLVLSKHVPGFGVYNIADTVPVSVNTIYKELLAGLGLSRRIIHLPYTVIAPVGYILETAYKALRLESPPLLTLDIARQLTQESSISLKKIKEMYGYTSPHTSVNGFRDLKVWVDSIGGIQAYTSKAIDPWQDKLFTY